MNIDGNSVTGLDNMSVSSVSVFLASSSNVTSVGSVVTLNTSGSDTGTPTVIRGKMIYNYDIN